jgi:hypothetical protein
MRPDFNQLTGGFRSEKSTYPTGPQAKRRSFQYDAFPGIADFFLSRRTGHISDKSDKSISTFYLSILSYQAFENPVGGFGNQFGTGVRKGVKFTAKRSQTFQYLRGY